MRFVRLGKDKCSFNKRHTKLNFARFQPRRNVKKNIWIWEKGPYLTLIVVEYVDFVCLLVWEFSSHSRIFHQKICKYMHMHWHFYSLFPKRRLWLSNSTRLFTLCKSLFEMIAETAFENCEVVFWCLIAFLN